MSASRNLSVNLKTLRQINLADFLSFFNIFHKKKRSRDAKSLFTQLSTDTRDRKQETVFLNRDSKNQLSSVQTRYKRRWAVVPGLSYMNVWNLLGYSRPSQPGVNLTVLSMPCQLAQRSINSAETIRVRLFVLREWGHRQNHLWLLPRTRKQHCIQDIYYNNGPNSEPCSEHRSSHLMGSRLLLRLFVNHCLLKGAQALKCGRRWHRLFTVIKSDARCCFLSGATINEFTAIFVAVVLLGSFFLKPD